MSVFDCVVSEAGGVCPELRPGDDYSDWSVMMGGGSGHSSPVFPGSNNNTVSHLHPLTYNQQQQQQLSRRQIKEKLKALDCPLKFQSTLMI